MKKIILVIMLVFSSLSYGQLAPPRQRIILNLPTSYVPTLKVGTGMIIGGVVLTTAGLLTPPLMVGGSTTQKQPFYKQGVRALAMVSGSVVFTIGVGKTLSDY
jgi:hypothetical protein